MSDSDSFINEVSEELRRDRLFALMRRWGWLAGLVVLAIVGAAAWFELPTHTGARRGPGLR